jgi:hypothetical protein
VIRFTASVLTTFNTGVNIAGIDILRYTSEAHTVSSPELVALIQRDRERHIEQDHLARVVACTKRCCSTSIADRVARALRLAPTTAC